MNRRNRLIIGALMGAFFVVLSWLGVGQALEEFTIDLRLRQRPPRDASGQVRIVAVDDHDVEQLGEWPIPRAAHADVLQILKALDVQQATFDVVFSEPSREPDQDEAFKSVVDDSGIVTLAYYFEDITDHPVPASEDSPHFLQGGSYGMDVKETDFYVGVRPKPLYTDFKASLAAANAKQSSMDEVVRHIPLLIVHQGRLYPTLALQTVMNRLHITPDQVRVTPGSEITLSGTPQGTLHIPINERGQLRINFGLAYSIFRESRDYLDLYAAAKDPGMAAREKQHFSNSTVLIGNVITGNTDTVVTPMGRLPGIVVQAVVVENILTGSHLQTPSPLFCFLIVLMLPLLLAVAMHPVRAWLSVVLFVMLGSAWGYMSWIAMAHDLILPFAAPIGAAAATLVTILPAQISGIVSRFGGYVPKALRTHLLSNEPVQARSRRRELTIFFSDIRGFTSWTENTDPDEVAEVLNEYLSSMADVVEEHRGTMDKFVGDCVMVFFGAPSPRKDHPEAAVRMAWDMQLRIEQLNAAWEGCGRERIGVGMGINTDFVTVGNFGSQRFQDYTVIGRGVNLAARVESIAPAGAILLTEKTNAMVQAVATTRPFGEVNLKGIAKPVLVHEVIGVASAGTRALLPDPAEWLVVENETGLGPFPWPGVLAMLATKRITPQSLVERVGNGKRTPLSELLPSNG